MEQVALSWNALGGASSYNVKRSDAADGVYVAVGLFVNGTSFVDKDLKAGRTYHYRVSANVSGGETNNSDAVSATPTFGLVGYWPLDGGATVTDSSVTINPSTLIGNISTTVAHRNGGIRLGSETFVATERNFALAFGRFLVRGVD
ncbi:MAG: fibronectin type III domain-containing protein [Anaerolineae bacterium]|nr:fibronectin type III domain-containing protein [Anaerolineae bacterium]